ncbi:hypothetical protein C7212DRAFT_351166 [Tuber magnatum]|uniref:Uncharacterized protein n=1 Tax=Tuber magnatum TaxID=42249 RepID=A0A317SS30_9PEZI|nr:hypothetical protein C7212DRAFT_351166 [Tuber magnatum]
MFTGRWAPPSTNPAAPAPAPSCEGHDGAMARSAPVVGGICRYGDQCQFTPGCRNPHPERLTQSDYNRQSEHMFHVGGPVWEQDVRHAEHKELGGAARRTQEKVHALGARLYLFRRDEHREREVRHRERVEALEEAGRGDARRMEERVEVLAVRLDNAGAKGDACGGMVNKVQQPERKALVAWLDNSEGKVDAGGERMEAMGALADPCMDRAWPDVAPIRGILCRYLLCASWLRGLLLSRSFRQVVCGVVVAVYLLLCICIKRPGQGVEIQGVEIHTTITASLVGPAPCGLADQPSPQRIDNHNPLNLKTATQGRVPFQPFSLVLSNQNGATGDLDSLPNKNNLQSIIKGPMPASCSGTCVVIAALTLIITVQALRIRG